MRARIDSAQMRVSQAAVEGAEPGLISAGRQPGLISAGSQGPAVGALPPPSSSADEHELPPSFQTGGAFTRSPPIGALVEPPRLRPAG